MNDAAFVDASPLIFLGDAGRLDLLRVAAPRVVVPDVVFREVEAYGADDPTVRALHEASWIEFVADVPVSDGIRAWDLGSGESQVLTQSAAARGAVAIIDDLEARRCARTLGIALRGTLGIVLLARRRGLVTSARELLTTFRKAGMYLTDEVHDRALREIGE